MAGVLVHKLRPSDVERGIPAADALAELRQFIEGKVLVGHFVHIDLKALRKELGDEQQQLSNTAIDTARAHRWLLQNGPWKEDLEQQMETISLAALAKIYDLDFREAHHALEDAFVTARGGQKTISRLEGMKIRKMLGELLRIAKA